MTLHKSTLLIYVLFLSGKFLSLHRQIVDTNSGSVGYSIVIEAKNARPGLKEVQKNYKVEKDTSELSFRKAKSKLGD